MRIKRSALYLTLIIALSVAVLAGCGGSVADNGDPTSGTTSGVNGVTEMGGTTTMTPTTEATTPPTSEVFFPKLKTSDGLPPSARIRGELVLDEEGCLRIDEGGAAPATLPLWPSYFKLSTGGDEIRILDGEGDFVARVGGRIDTGGGEMQHGETTPRETFQTLRRGVGEDMARELRERCPGPYWLVGPSEDHIQ
jgi:hypothetical protein